MDIHVRSIPIAGNPACPIRSESSEGLPGEIGDAVVFRDTNGAPMFRLALSDTHHGGGGEWQITPLTDAVVVRINPAVFRC